ncbi:hypothetical protein ACOME3_005569 [Neoechinorhynchus agilis]
MSQWIFPEASKKRFLTIKAVRSYSFMDESLYLFVRHIPWLGEGSLKDDLVNLITEICGRASIVKVSHVNSLPDEEPFESTILIKMNSIANAKLTKSRFDDHSFYGSCLHVCYAPEMETTEETKAKFDQRALDVVERRNALSDFWIDFDSKLNIYRSNGEHFTNFRPIDLCAFLEDKAVSELVGKPSLITCSFIPRQIAKKRSKVAEFIGPMLPKEI